MLSHLEEFPALTIAANPSLICSILYTLFQVLKRQKSQSKIVLCDSKWKLRALQLYLCGTKGPPLPGGPCLARCAFSPGFWARRLCISDTSWKKWELWWGLQGMVVVLHLLLFLNPAWPARYLQGTGIPLLPAAQLGWQGPLTAPVALVNPFYVCIHIPFPPLAQGFHPEGENSGNSYIMAIISVLAGMDFPKSKQARNIQKWMFSSLPVIQARSVQSVFSFSP